MLSKLLDKLRVAQSLTVEVTSQEVKAEIVREVQSRGWAARFTERRELHTKLDKYGWHLQAGTDIQPPVAEIMRTQ